jgi:hypothetical protein
MAMKKASKIRQKVRKPTAKKPVKKPAKKKLPGDRKDFKEHNELIAAAYFTYLSRHKRLPTIRYLAEATGLGTSAVQKHLKSQTFESRLESLQIIQADMWALFINKVKSAKNPIMWRLFFELTEKDFRQKVDLTSKGKEIKPNTAKYILPDGTAVEL